MSNKWVIKDADGNITNAGIKGQESWVRANFDYFEAYIEPDLSLSAEQEARMWRDMELSATDNTPSDHSQYEAIIAYRVSLRSWPSQDTFPATKPTLGS